MIGKICFRVLTSISIVLFFVTFVPLSLFAQGDVTSMTIDTLNVRGGPGTDYDTVSTISPRVDVIVEGRNDIGNWSLVRTLDGGIRGWVASRYLIWESDTVLDMLPVLTETWSAPPPVESVAVESAPVASAPVVAAPATRVDGVTVGVATGVTNSPLKVRAGAGKEHPMLTNIPLQTNIVIEGRNPVGDWFLMHTPDNSAHGWVASRYVVLADGIALEGLPVVEAQFTSDVYDMMAGLRSTPVIASATANARAIYQRGLAQGNQPNRFSKVGDCQSVPDYFLSVFDQPGEYSLGPQYTYLQDAVDHFSGSFARESQSVSSGFSVYAVLDPTWANPGVCLPGESPQACEYRIWKPSFVIISMETLFGDTARNYEVNMRAILEFWISKNVVPILATKADNREGDWSINVTISQLAREYNIPLWNFLMATQPLQGFGLTDGFHLTYAPNYFDNATCMASSWPWRNLTALQSLESVWRGVAG
jgi:uncharacterized protein YraI